MINRIGHSCSVQILYLLGTEPSHISRQERLQVPGNVQVDQPFSEECHGEKYFTRKWNDNG